VHDGIGLIEGEEEGQVMKRHWARGMLLGVSVALLLGGGVALAQSVLAWPDCFQCNPAPILPAQADGPYQYNWESCGWQPGEPLYYRETFANGEYWACPPYCDYPYSADENGCASDGPWGWACAGTALHHSGDVSAGNEWVWPDDFWGPFEICVSPLDSADQVSADQVVCDTILFAEVCEVEFVPEPGSILLLGSGLAGLAGYAVLRLRSGQALRWRARE
jgi:hypothetical protein